MTFTSHPSAPQPSRAAKGRGWTEPRLISLLLFAALLAFYTYTLLPSLAWVDGMKHQQEVISGESLTLAEIPDSVFAPDPFPFARLSVAAWDHPLYVIAGHTILRLLPGVSSLWLVNFFSAIFGAAAVAVLFRLCHIHTDSIGASLIAAFALAVSHTYWFHSVTPETYAPFTFLLLSSVYLFDRYERTQRRADLLAAAFLLGAGGSVHLLAFFAFPALASYLWLSGRLSKPSLGEARKLIAPGAAFVLGFSAYWIQLFRMMRTFSVAQIVGPVAGSFFVRDVVVTTSATPLIASALYYLLLLVNQFGPVGIALGLYGWRAGAKAWPELWRKAAALYVVFLAFAIFYRVLEQYAIFMFAHVFWAMAMAMGAARLLERLRPSRRAWSIAGLGAIFATMPLYYAAQPGLMRALGFRDDTFNIPPVGTGVRDGLAYYLNPNKRGYYEPYNFGRETLANLPPDSVVIAEWYNDVDEALVLRYFQMIEGMRPDVKIVIWLLEDPTTFDPALAVAEVQKAWAANRPVFLASLDDKFYDGTRLKQDYCVVPEDNLYRVYPTSPANSPSLSCLTP